MHTHTQRFQAQASSNDLEAKDEPLPMGWEERQDADGRIFYIDHINQRTQWECPSWSDLDSRQRCVLYNLNWDSNLELCKHLVDCFAACRLEMYIHIHHNVFTSVFILEPMERWCQIHGGLLQLFKLIRENMLCCGVLCLTTPAADMPTLTL